MKKRPRERLWRRAAESRQNHVGQGTGNHQESTGIRLAGGSARTRGSLQRTATRIIDGGAMVAVPLLVIVIRQMAPVERVAMPVRALVQHATRAAL